MKIYILILVSFFIYFIVKAQPFANNNNTPKKEVAFTKRKSAFEIKEKINQTKIWENPDSAIEFKEGIVAYKKFVENNLDVNIPIINNAPEGQYSVKIDLTINYLGEIINAIPLTKHGFGMEQEVIRVISLTKAKWASGKVNNTTVTSKILLVFSFNVIDA